MADESFPVKRLENESPQAFEAFVVYAEMGSGRSIDKAFRRAKGIENKAKTASPQWCKYSTDFDWVRRSREYDDWMFEKRKQEKLDLRRRLIDELGDRIIKTLDNDLGVSDSLLERLKTFVQEEKMTPLHFKTVCDAHKSIVSTRKDVYTMMLDATGLSDLAELIRKEVEE